MSDERVIGQPESSDPKRSTSPSLYANLPADGSDIPPSVQLSLSNISHASCVPGSDYEDCSDSDGLGDPLFSFLRSSTSSQQSGNYRATVLKPSAGSKLVAAPLKPRNKLKYSLSALVSEREKEDTLDGKIALAERILQISDAHLTSDTGLNVKKSSPSPPYLKTETIETENEDALEKDKPWFFFDRNIIPWAERPFFLEAEKEDVSFPLEDASFRNQQFLSGFLDVLAVQGALPEGLLIWILENIPKERRTDLCRAYRQLVEALPTENLVNLLSSSRIQKLFISLGGMKDALDIHRPIYNRLASSSEVSFPNVYNIQAVIELLGNVAHRLTNEAVSSVVILMLRLSLDKALRLKTELLADIEHSLSKVIDAISEEIWQFQVATIGEIVQKTVTVMEHRVTLLNTIPAHCSRLHLFRRQLALCFLFNDVSYLARNYEDMTCISEVIRLLAGSEFQICSDTDYEHFRGCISLIDIAIDSGSISGESDGALDELIDNLQSIFSAIIDANARDLKRTEVKDAIERLQFRLVGTVHSKGIMRAFFPTPTMTGDNQN